MTIHLRKQLYQTLEKLSNAHGISGFEKDIRSIITQELETVVDDIHTDALGNLVAVKNGGETSLMLAAHMDEIGLMIQSIEPEGFLRFVTLGGWHEQILLNNRVILHTDTGPVLGVIGSKPPHLLTAEEKKKEIKLDDLFIDIGAPDDKMITKKNITIGTPVTLDRCLQPLLDNKVTGKALDDRAGVAMLIEALKNAHSSATIFFVGTVQEEVGLKGARTSAFHLDPDAALVGETAVASDHPGGQKIHASPSLGKGPVITVADASGRGIIAPHRILSWLRSTAGKHNIPYQLEVSKGGTTDAAAIHLTKAGIPSGVISIPTRYLHSGVEVLSLNDLEQGTQLFTHCLETVDSFFPNPD
jgi:endoglucanase